MRGCAASLLALSTLCRCAAHAAVRPSSPAFLGVEVPTRWVLALSHSVGRRPAEAPLPAGEPDDPAWAAAKRRPRCFYVTSIFLLALFCAVCCCYCCCLDRAGVAVCLGLTCLGLFVAIEASVASGLHHAFAKAAEEGRPLPLQNAWCWLPLSLTAFWSAWHMLGILLMGGVLLMSCVALGVYSYVTLARNARSRSGDPGRPWPLSGGDGRKAFAGDEAAAAASLAEDDEGEEESEGRGANSGGRRHGTGAAAVECAVCLNRYTVVSRRPQVLGCGHTFCSACVAQLTRRGRLTCPTCREELSAKEVRVNYALRDVMADHSLVQGSAGRSGSEKAREPAAAD